MPNDDTRGMATLLEGTYVSEGTIRCMITAETQECFFTPNKDHCVKHRGNSYAAFVQESGELYLYGRLLENGEVELPPSDRESFIAAALPAATHQVNIEVQVEVTVREENPTLQLTAVTVPTKPAK